MTVSKGLKKFDQGQKMAEALASALESITSKDSMMRYGKMAADMIKLRTRLGAGVSDAGAVKGNLKRLAASTRDSREILKAKGKLSDQTSPGKSNLTRTGQLLNSMRATDPSEGTVLVGPAGTRDDGKTNEDIGAHVTAGGRPFNNLSKTEIKRMNDALKSDLKAAVRRQLTKKK